MLKRLRGTLFERTQAEQVVPATWRCWVDARVSDGGVDARYFGAIDIEQQQEIVIPIQVKMHRIPSVVRPDMDPLLGTQTAMQNRGVHAPMSLMVSLYPPPESLRMFAMRQGRVTLTTNESGRTEYPRMQVLSVEEMLRRGERPKLPLVDPRSLVGNTQTRTLLV